MDKKVYKEQVWREIDSRLTKLKQHWARGAAQVHQEAFVTSISYSSSGFADRDVEAALDAIVAAGFTQAELCGQDPHVEVLPRGRALDQFRARLEGRGLAGGTVHAPMRKNVLGAPEEDWRRDKVEVLSAYLRFTGAIGYRSMVIHPVPNPIFVRDPERAELPGAMVAAARRSLDELVPVARAAGVRMLLENLPYDCAYPLLTMEELRPLVDDYPEEAVGLVVDTGHAWTIGRDPAEQIRIAGKRLAGTHIQDVDGANPQDNHWLPGQGDLNWSDIRGALAEIDYTGPWTFEVIVARRGESAEELARLTRQVANQWGLDDHQ
ncbi:MAG: TIM barrel protein [Candidatus Latescibacteria bacterium]|nr:TIM barrel protein [Candidatus Latescibacterota bacterium]